jgi:hypothetical protein
MMVFPCLQVYSLRMKKMKHWLARNLVRMWKSLPCTWVTLSKCHITKGDLKELLVSITPLFYVQSTRVSASTNSGLDNGDDYISGSDKGDKYLMKCVTWSNPGYILAVWFGLLCYLNWTIPIQSLLTQTHSLCNLANLTKWIYGEAY